MITILVKNHPDVSYGIEVEDSEDLSRMCTELKIPNFRYEMKKEQKVMFFTYYEEKLFYTFRKP